MLGWDKLFLISGTVKAVGFFLTVEVACSRRKSFALALGGVVCYNIIGEPPVDAGGKLAWRPLPVDSTSYPGRPSGFNGFFFTSSKHQGS
jgi:hypothetical protein